VKNILQRRYDWNSPCLNFKGKTVARTTIRGRDGYEVILDDAPDCRLKLSSGCLKYIFANNRTSSNYGGAAESATTNVCVPTGSLIPENNAFAEDESEEEVDFNLSAGWTAGEVYIDSMLEAVGGYVATKSRINMSNSLAGSPFDYFLYFLPVDYFKVISDNMNIYARSAINSWTDVTFPEYMMWIALLTVMTVIKHSDRKTYWHLGNSHFQISINFSSICQ
jgi:hypothetical protein